MQIADCVPGPATSNTPNFTETPARTHAATTPATSSFTETTFARLEQERMQIADVWSLVDPMTPYVLWGFVFALGLRAVALFERPVAQYATVAVAFVLGSPPVLRPVAACAADTGAAIVFGALLGAAGAATWVRGRRRPALPQVRVVRH